MIFRARFSNIAPTLKDNRGIKTYFYLKSLSQNCGECDLRDRLLTTS